MQKLKDSLILKSICYILAPIFVILIGLCIYSVIYVNRNPDVVNTKSFYETRNFSEIYQNMIINLYSYYDGQIEITEFSSPKDIHILEEFSNIEGIQTEVESPSDNIIYDSSYINNNLKYIIIDKNGYIQTNIYNLNRNNMESIIENILKQWVYWIKTDKINTTINNLSEQNAPYTLIKNIPENKVIYTYLDTNYPIKDYFKGELDLYNFVTNAYKWIYYKMALCSIRINCYSNVFNYEYRI